MLCELEKYTFFFKAEGEENEDFQNTKHFSSSLDCLQLAVWRYHSHINFYL